MPRDTPSRFNREVCPETITTGSCTTPGCAKQHSIFPCEVCAQFCISRKDLEQHTNSRKHQNKLNKSGGASPPGVARSTTTGNSVLDDDSDDDGSVDGSEAVSTLSSGAIRCHTCNKNISLDRWANHSKSKDHAKREKIQTYKVALRESEMNKMDIVIREDALDFGVFDGKSFRSRSASFHIDVAAGEEIILHEVRTVSSTTPSGTRHPIFSLRFSGPKRLGHGPVHNVAINFDPKGKESPEIHT
ncbi:hypothetical protein FRC02_004061 [Tulasnella sp. 418]|nr:hypothetical protein FRC02_004061 [Tulasnella sp. 418]